MATSKQAHEERVQALANTLDLGISASSRIFSEICEQDELADLTMADLIDTAMPKGFDPDIHRAQRDRNGNVWF